MRPLLILAAAVLFSPTGAVAAPIGLLSSDPAAHATVAKPTRLKLTFSDPIVAHQSRVDIVMTGMPGMADHPPMPVKGFQTEVAPDGRTLIVILPRALPPGSYDLKWHVVGADGHGEDGAYSFKAR